MKPVSELLPRLMPRVVGCPEPMALQALVDSAIEFCERSLVIRHTLDGFATIPEVAEYDLDAPYQQRVARVISVTCDGLTLTAVPPTAPGELVQLGLPNTYSTRYDGTTTVLELRPTPDSVKTIVVQVAASPTTSATALEDELVGRWFDALLAGATSRLMVTPNQPFSNFELAAMYSNMYRGEIGRAIAVGHSGRVQTSRTVGARPFA